MSHWIAEATPPVALLGSHNAARCDGWFCVHAILHSHPKNLWDVCPKVTRFCCTLWCGSAHPRQHAHTHTVQEQDFILLLLRPSGSASRSTSFLDPAVRRWVLNECKSGLFLSVPSVHASLSCFHLSCPSPSPPLSFV